MKRHFIPPLFGFFGVAFLVAAYWVNERSKAFLLTAESTTGEVMELVSSGSDLRSKAPVVVFYTDEGEKIVFRSHHYSKPAAYEVGETINILYQAQDPIGSARVESYFSLWGVPLIFGILGGVFLFLGIILGFLLRK